MARRAGRRYGPRGRRSQGADGRGNVAASQGLFLPAARRAGRQIEEPVNWAVNDFLAELPERVSVTVEGRAVALRAWIYRVAGPGDFSVPVYFLTVTCRRIPSGIGR